MLNDSYNASQPNYEEEQKRNEQKNQDNINLIEVEDNPAIEVENEQKNQDNINLIEVEDDPAIEVEIEDNYASDDEQEANNRISEYRTVLEGLREELQNHEDFHKNNNQVDNDDDDDDHAAAPAA